MEAESWINIDSGDAAWRHQASILNNVDLSLVELCSIPKMVKIGYNFL